MNKNYAFVGTLFFLLFLVPACSSRPELGNYPQREIDRPYTLPDGVTSWSTVASGYYAKDADSSSFGAPIPVPLIWDQSLSDSLDLLWAPIPMGLRYQFLQNEDWRLGGTVAWGFSIASSSGFSIYPSASLNARRFFGGQWALELGLTASASYSFKSKDSSWSTGLQAGPLWQFNDAHALKVANAFAVTDSFSAEIEDDDISEGVGTRFTVTPGMTHFWNFSQQWNLSSSYFFSGIGYDNDFQAHNFTLVLEHLW